jgi:thiol-disulfide isomerase/thioredoxin
MEYIKQLTPKDFDDVATWKLKDKKCCAVLFYADWCPHCQVVKPTWNRLGKEAAFLDFYSFDCEKHASHLSRIKEDMPELVKGFPTIVFYSGGQPVEAYKGDRSYGDILTACMKVCKNHKV